METAAAGEGKDGQGDAAARGDDSLLHRYEVAGVDDREGSFGLALLGTGAVQSVDASSSGSGNYFTSYGKFYDTFYGSITYNQAYTDGRLRFWNSAATRPTFAGEWHGTFW